MLALPERQVGFFAELFPESNWLHFAMTQAKLSQGSDGLFGHVLWVTRNMAVDSCQGTWVRMSHKSRDRLRIDTRFQSIGRSRVAKGV